MNIYEIYILTLPTLELQEILSDKENKIDAKIRSKVALLQASQKNSISFLENLSVKLPLLQASKKLGYKF